MEDSDELLLDALAHYAGRRCIDYIAGPLLDLDFEPRIRRKHPSQNTSLSEEQRLTQGELGIFIGCTWRLDSASAIICGAWDDYAAGGRIQTGLQLLKGRRLERFSVERPGQDLDLFFENLKLRLFCDQVNEHDQGTNYSLFLPDRIVTVGRRSKIELEISERP